MSDDPQDRHDSIDEILSRMDKQDEAIAELRKMMTDIATASVTNDNNIQSLSKALVQISTDLGKSVETLNKQSEIINQHSEALGALLENHKAAPQQQAAQTPLGANGPATSQDAQVMSRLLDFAEGMVKPKPQPSNMDQFFYQQFPSFMADMFKENLESMRVNNEIGKEVINRLRKSTGSAMASDVLTGVFTK